MRGEIRERYGLIFPFVRLIKRGSRLAELLIFPSVCRRCLALLERPDERILCQDCLAGFVPGPPSHCPSCGRFFDGDGAAHLCGGCLRRPPSFSTHRSAARYDGAVKDALLLFKYRGLRPLGRPLAAFLHASIGRFDPPWTGADLFVPVPLHRRRRRERGFNQAEILAVELSRLTGVPVEARVLRKTINVQPQASLRSEERRANIRGAYRAVRPEMVAGKIVVLVDDVFTTGSTLGECARVLAKAGARDVRGVTIAQA
jgi:competence protein ComFC